MEQITEKTIINAIMALDVEKLKVLKESLVKTLDNNKKIVDTNNRILRALEAAELKGCSEYKALYTNHLTLCETNGQLYSLIDKCDKALESLNN